MYQKINEATAFIRSKLNQPIDMAIICGSGLGSLADLIEDATVINYEEIPHFPISTIPGHEGKLVIGRLEGKHVLAMKGRFHYYEGHDMDIVTLPIRVFCKLGIKTMIITNACGGIREDLNPGQITLIRDHIGFMAPSALRGPNLDEFGPRFKDMSEVYSKSLRAHAMKCAETVHLSLKEGVYGFFQGPMFETPAEIRAFQILGVDMVGMSTVPEAIVARHCGMNTLGISFITNKAAGLSANELNHQEVMDVANQSEQDMLRLVKEFVKTYEA